MTFSVSERSPARAKVRYDRELDVLYLLFRRGAQESSVELAPGVTLELDARRNVIGLELLRASRILGRPAAHRSNGNGHGNGRRRTH